MNRTGISSGDEVDSYCGKCKLERVHHVVALVDNAVVKVVCKTCGSRHRYKPMHPEPRKKAGKRTPGATTATKGRQAQLWEKALAEKGSAGSKAYSITGSFEQGDVIEHERFGLGLVTETEGQGKMHVLFKEGPKRLVCNRAR